MYGAFWSEFAMGSFTDREYTNDTYSMRVGIRSPSSSAVEENGGRQNGGIRSLLLRGIARRYLRRPDKEGSGKRTILDVYDPRIIHLPSQWCNVR